MITIVKKIGTTMIFHGRLKRMLRRFALSHAQKEGKTEGICSDTIIEKQKIESLHEDGRVVFVDGSWVLADTIIYCTGYSYAFPFLDTKGIVAVDDDRVGPLYEHTFPPSLAPSLSFVGIPRKIIGFPFFESQAIWIAQLLSGRKTLPSFHEMMQSIEDFYQSRDAAGIPKHHTHDIADFEGNACLPLQYCDKYLDNFGFPHLEEWRKELILSGIGNDAQVNLETYRDAWMTMSCCKWLFRALISPNPFNPHLNIFPSSKVTCKRRKVDL
ncbi:Flavin-containing monooxygenase FMO GS-OX-like 9 [Vitis vinifera]|uniref:Flavin-containing monooxygenase n=1 Tax=Vitis vinifera TaxID=29760 RepID=A0A438HG55_VITVI|nr:Flavin-containing monooxygenase FMO GS-OX-like 9 [Vitis vinifera]